MSARRVAAFDLGTNTTLCAVVERAEGGAIRVLGDRAIITGLGRGARPALAPEAIARTLAAVTELSAWARGLGAETLAAVGTSALRDAPNRDALLEPMRRDLGIDAQAIAGAREAELTFAGARIGIEDAPAALTVIDVGGGSTEIVRGDGDRVHGAVSLDVGAVRLTERWLAHDPPTASEIDALERDVARAIEAGGAGPLLVPPLLCLAGSATNVAACALGVPVSRYLEVVGRRVPAGALEACARRIAATPIAGRLSLGGIEPGREATIAGGALVLAALVRAAGATEAWIGDGGVRFGLALERLAAPGP